jgi:hypothetical protein
VAHQWHPGLELCVGLEGVGAVVQELELLHARRHQQAVETADLERAVHARLDNLQVCAI